MKKSFYLFVCAIVIIFSACSSSRNSDNQLLNSHTWELESISGSKLSFEELFPAKKPQLTFEKENKTVRGIDGCNGYSAPFIVNGNKISFGEPGPSTLMYCGEGEALFREKMKKIDAYKVDEGKLLLLSENAEMLRFHKKDS